MVAHLVRLKLTLLRNGLRRSPWQVVALALVVLNGLGLLGLAAVGLVALGFVDVPLRGDVLVLGGGLLVLGWWVVPLVAFGMDSTLDPRRFATFGVARRDLLLGLLLSGLVGVPGVVTAGTALATSLAWWDTPAAAVAALVGAVLGVASCTIGARATTSALAPLLARRRVRELVAALAIVPVMFLGPILTAATAGVSRLDGLASVAGVVSWTPVGAPWAIAPAVAAGDWAGAGLRVLVALATLAVALRVWSWALDRTLTEPAGGGGGGARARGLGWFGVLPATPTGAVAARAATYWVRDPRYAIAVAVVPLLPVILAVSGRGDAVLFAGPATAFVVGWSISADVAYDGTAFWTHLVAPMRARADRWGRVVAAGLVGLLATVLVVVGTAWFAGRFDALPALLGASLGLLLVSLGGSSVMSALVVYPVQLPGENPFGSKQGASTAAFVSQLVGFTLVAVLAAPALVLGLLAVVQGSATLGWVALAVGPVLGVAVLVGGVLVGARVLEQRGPDLLSRMRQFA